MKKLVLWGLLLALSTLASGQVVINEFLAANTTTNPEMVDFGDYSDWIELYNTGNSEADLSGFYLTDNLNDPLKWQIPFGAVIAPKGFLVIWADGNDVGPGQSFMRPYWPWEYFSTQNYHTNFKLSSTGEELGLYKSSDSLSETFIKKADTWKYLDDGTNQGDAWRNADYDDSAWKSGPAQLGYGENDEATIVSYGPNSDNKYVTTYFRKSFTINDLDDYKNFVISLLRDDGAIVYLNGEEILRSNMPDGTIQFDTFSQEVVGDDNETRYFITNFDNLNLVAGSNVLAVELHQCNATSSDLSFDLDLIAQKKNSNLEVVLIDSVIYGHQVDDVSFGRTTDGAGAWTFFGEATPGKSNNSIQVNELKESGDVTFSQSGGFYTGGMTVSLSAVTGVIHYTTDGSIPHEASSEYTGPISINETTVIRARVFESGNIPGPVTTNTYFINENFHSLPIVSFVSDPLTLWDSKIGIYDNDFKQREVPVSIEYFNENSAAGFKVNAGTRIGGYNIWRFAQKPFTVYMRGKYGDDNINYQLFPNKPIGIIGRIVFRNGGDNWQNSMLNDAMMEAIVKGYMDNGIMAYTPCEMYLNGEYWGVHNIREKFDSQYFAQNFKIDPTQYTHLEYTFIGPNQVGRAVVEGTMDEYDAMMDFINNNDLTDPVNSAKVDSMIDFDSFIDYISIETWDSNTSWRHNREWWKANTPDGKWRWLVPDLDRGMNMDNIGNNILREYINEYTLFNRLLTNPKFKNRFVQRFSSHLNNTLNNVRIKTIVDSLAANVTEAMPYHIARWKNEDGIQSMDAWNNSITELKNFADNRIDYVFDDIAQETDLEAPASLQVIVSDTKGGDIYLAGVRMLEYDNRGRYFKDVPLDLKAVPRPGYTFTGWEGISTNQFITINLLGDSTITAKFVKSAESVITQDIKSNTVLTQAQSPWVAPGDITVRQNVTLTIEPGVEIKMPAKGNINVYGKLVINGTAEKPVIIGPNSKTEAQQWGAINFINAPDTCVLSYVKISHATNGPDPVNQKSAISAYNSILKIDHVEISDVAFPIFVRFGSTIMKNSTISATGTCDYINIKQGYGDVENCVFYGNNFPDTDAIDYDGVINGIIRNNRVYNFIAPNCDAIDIGEEAKNILVTGNVFYNCFDKGVSIGQLSTVTVTRNLFVKCDMGVAVKDNSHALIDQNTFYNNHYSVACYEKIFGNGGGIATVTNNIMSNSTMQTVLIDSLSEMEISYSLSDTDLLPGMGNIVADPGFEDPDNYNFQLKSNSICFNAGDPDHAKDMDGSVADIGGYYIYNAQDIPFAPEPKPVYQIVVNEIMYKPNKNADSKDWIELFNTTASTIDLSGWKITDSDTAHAFKFPENTVISAQSWLVVCRDPQAFANIYPDVNNYISGLEYGFGEIDQVRLYDTNDSLKVLVNYKNTAPWPWESDGKGASLELLSPEHFNSLPVSWHSSSVANGTPGRANSVPVSVEESGKTTVPIKYVLEQNYPNPFNPVTTISFALPVSGHVTLKIYDILGQEVETLVNNDYTPGLYRVSWRPQNIAAGVYFYRLVTKKFTQTKKLLLLK